MPKATKKSSWEQSPPPSEKHASTDNQAETSGLDQEEDPEISFHPAVPPSIAPTMFMPLTSSRIYWIRTPPSRKELLWKLVTLSSYWSFVSRTPTFLSKTSSMNRLRVLPWVPQSAPLWPTSTWST